ncbi:MAG: CapA family protein [Lautropia sp.]
MSRRRSSSTDARLLAVGDVYLDRVAHDTDLPWGPLTALRAGVDAALCNYEAPISDLGTPLRGRAVPLRTPSAHAAEIARAWDVMSLAQNHILDYGEAAALETLAICKANGIAVSGFGADLDQALAPARFEAGGLPFSLFAIACAYPRSYAAGRDRCGVAALPVTTAYVEPDLETEHPGMAPRVATSCDCAMLADICGRVSAEAAAGRRVLVYVHWGVPGVTQVLDYQRELGSALAAAGATAVLGTHAHVLQGIEVVGKVPILYGMSHVVFDLPGILSRWPAHEAATYAAVLDFREGALARLELTPLMMTERDGRSHLERHPGRQVHEILVLRSLGMQARLEFDDRDGKTVLDLRGT